MGDMVAKLTSLPNAKPHAHMLLGLTEEAPQVHKRGSKVHAGDPWLLLVLAVVCLPRRPLERGSGSTLTLVSPRLFL